MESECLSYCKTVSDEIKTIIDEGIDADEYEKSISDYLCDALYIEYVVNDKKQLIGAMVYVTLGGPTCYIDTRHNEIVTSWGTDRASLPIENYISETINEILNEYFMEV